MKEIDFTICGPGDVGCPCKCPDGPCGHRFDKDWESEDGRTGSLQCSKCGKLAIEHDIWIMP